MSPLSPTIQYGEIINFVEDFFDRHNRTPSVSEIADRFNVSKSTAHGYLNRMQEEELIQFKDRTIITENLALRLKGLIRVPILGDVGCSNPDLNIDEVSPEDYIDLPIAVFGSHPCYILTAHGDSMINAGIEPGDMVLVRKQDTAQNKDLVVAYIPGDGMTLKRYMIDRKTGRAYLHPENPEYPDIYPEQMWIHGVVQSTIRDVK